ncbi:hypothetical protein BXZ70DRAFT_910817 [Cristinia sonorae]|uniref:Uncharacterized protein n=1 Tax=Cristinia sonorae TaxID=1940300 RepID=A0A8K0UEC9_9AGAR|nr:hypothetical protein BXZ70DRAFT_910817 [Cristinia sonorae]
MQSAVASKFVALVAMLFVLVATVNAAAIPREELEAREPQFNALYNAVVPYSCKAKQTPVPPLITDPRGERIDGHGPHDARNGGVVVVPQNVQGKRRQWKRQDDKRCVAYRRSFVLVQAPTVEFPGNDRERRYRDTSMYTQDKTPSTFSRKYLFLGGEGRAVDIRDRSKRSVVTVIEVRWSRECEASLLEHTLGCSGSWSMRRLLIVRGAGDREEQTVSSFTFGGSTSPEVASFGDKRERAQNGLVPCRNPTSEDPQRSVS